MKKIIAILTIALISTTTVAFADNNRAIDNSRVLTAFHEKFSTTSNVSWYKTKGGYIARFTLHSSKVTAHFDESGHLITTSRTITDSELPLRVITGLIKKYPDQKIHHITEFNNEEGSVYVIILESDSNWTTLKVTANSEISLIKSLQKA